MLAVVGSRTASMNHHSPRTRSGVTSTITSPWSSKSANFTYGTASTHARSIGTLPVRGSHPILSSTFCEVRLVRDELDRDRPVVVAIARQVHRQADVHVPRQDDHVARIAEGLQDRVERADWNVRLCPNDRTQRPRQQCDQGSYRLVRWSVP
jgi:hypothetical protein